MSLKRLSTLSDNVLNVIMYVSSPSLEFFIKTELKERFKVHKDFIVTVESDKELKDAKLDSYVAPLFCDKWLIHVNADKLSKKELKSALGKNTVHGITVYWTSKYQIYKQFLDTDEVKKQAVYNPQFSFSRLSEGDIRYLHSRMLEKKKQLKPELLDFVAKNYRFDVQAVCELFALLRSGNEIRNKREVIEKVGVGGNSVSSLVIQILKANINTEKGRTAVMKKTVKLLEDLSITYKHSTIKNYMLNTIEAFIDMKELQVMGIYGKAVKEIPDSYDTKRLSMNKRFEYIVLNQISLPSLLNLKLCLLHFNSFNAEIALLQAISEYYNSIKIEE